MQRLDLLNDAWMRDTGPTVLLNFNGGRPGIDWQFNARGGKLGGLYDDWR
ncbi:MAG: agmatine deiminase family protein, partial [Symbiopectobacterium sp.]